MKMQIALAAALATSLVSTTALADGVVANRSPGGPVDFARAKPMPMPRALTEPPSLSEALATRVPDLGPQGFSPGHVGDGRMRPEAVPPLTRSGAPIVGPAQFGTSNQPFTTVRADAYGNATSRYYPFRVSGKLFFKVGSSTYMCSASLIRRGLVVTAAHCVARFGVGWNSSWQFIPAYSNGSAPFGVWTTRRQVIMGSYLNGTDSCYQRGVICQNDVAVLELTAKSGTYPGTSTGWYGACWGGYGFTGPGLSNGALTHITELGYPGGLDNGALMERTDSYGIVSSTMSFNTLIGSQQGGGASGGPWLINFGVAPAVTGTDGVQGAEASSNCVVGTASWAYTGGSSGVRRMGASPFLSSNIGALISNACANAASSAVCN